MAKKVDVVFEDLVNKIADIYVEEALKGLTYLGEECVKRLREQGRENDWKDQTANLRSSTGFAVFDYGKVYFQSAFEPILSKKTGAPGTKGHDKGVSYIEQLAKAYTQTYALVVVAGMDYAEYVEKRRDVLASTELWARQRIEKVLGVFFQRAEKRAQAVIDNI